jgi:hypothetical protein
MHRDGTRMMVGLTLKAQGETKLRGNKYQSYTLHIHMRLHAPILSANPPNLQLAF